MNLSASVIKKMTGCKTRALGESALYTASRHKVGFAVIACTTLQVSTEVKVSFTLQPRGL
jgi:hypothetical protein